MFFLATSLFWRAINFCASFRLARRRAYFERLAPLRRNKLTVVVVVVVVFVGAAACLWAQAERLPHYISIGFGLNLK